MAERNRRHIVLTDLATVEPFTPVGGGRPATAPPSPSDRAGHAGHLSDSLRSAVDVVSERRQASVVTVEGAVSGIYVEFESLPGFELALTSLEPRQGKVHPEVRAVTEETVDGKVVQKATVFVPDEWVGRFVQRFEEYASENTKSGKPKNRNLVERIAELRLATVRALWTDDPADFPAPGERVWWEVWLRRRDGTNERLDSFAAEAGIRVRQRRLIFGDRVVALVEATPEQVGSSLESLDDIAELRRPAEPRQAIADLDAADQADFVNDLGSRLVPPPSDAPRTCLLDTSVSAAHPLIEPALDLDDLHTIDGAWGLHDRIGHGTSMAGLVLYSDLGHALMDAAPVELVTRLESVKILPNQGGNDPDLYAAITAQAVALVEIQAPQAKRTFVLAVTAPASTRSDDRSLGEPTSWSAAIDALAAGREIDGTDEGLVYLDDPTGSDQRFFVICVGNVRHPLDLSHLDRSDAEPAEDPAHAWNALTVGAWTDLSDPPAESVFAQWRPLSPAGELSPFSRTTVGYKRVWRLGPDIVLEGGNAAVAPDEKTIDTPGSLQVLTTRSLSLDGGRLVTTFSGTSPATASAAHLIATIRNQYPDLWPETIRGLVVHSARWTKPMQADMHAAPTRKARVGALRRYGWGVPDPQRALLSAADSVTLISEKTIRPYDDGRMREMHLHDLPWPVEVLAELGETEVHMRVSLSYFIEPNPARRGWTQRYRYASHGLRFDVRRPTETTDEFRKRINKLAMEEEEKRPPSADDTGDWLLGPQERVRGSLHVDHWKGTAADLAARGCVAIYPVTGWWKELKTQDRSENGVRYSLIVSIETPGVETDIWTPVAIAAEVTAEVTTEIQF